MSGALEELLALGLVEKVEEKPVEKRARVEKVEEGPVEERAQATVQRFTIDEAKANWVAYLAKGGQHPQTHEELLQMRLECCGLREGEYRRKDGSYMMRGIAQTYEGEPIEESGESSLKEADTPVMQITDTAEASQIEAPVDTPVMHTDTAEAAGEPFEESQMM